MTENNDDLAGVSSDHIPPEEDRNPDTARTVFPVSFEKDYMDFRPEDEVATEGPLVPKSSAAPASVGGSGSVTGLEDVSAEDLETSALQSAGKDLTKKP